MPLPEPTTACVKPLNQAGLVSPDHWYLRFRPPTGATEPLVFCFPRHLLVRQCIAAAKSVLPEGWQFVEPDQHPGY